MLRAEFINMIIHGDCLEKLKELPENSVDSVITDPPYELGFMGKSWDNTGIANNIEMWREVLRVLKPGGHLLSFGGTRTYHRMACAIEGAGFEIRDMIEWVYGSGFPKSLNIGKAVDKLQGNEREIDGNGNTDCPYLNKGEKCQGHGEETSQSGKTIHTPKSKGTSEWEGWGTALKPAHEPICMARKPLSEKTVAENVLKYGTGGINIDESRVGETGARNNGNSIGTLGSNSIGVYGKAIKQDYSMGRFPANLIHNNSEEVRECFPDTKSGGGLTKRKNNEAMFDFGQGYSRDEISDSGNASRFFKSIIYQAKASKSERNAGIGVVEDENKRPQGEAFGDGSAITEHSNRKGNFHPTVKPVALMEYLINMVTPKNGIVLDPFAGSGTTGVACINTGRNYILIEKEREYIDIINKRLNEKTH